MAMVGSVTNLTRNGVKDWLVQRVSAVVLATYAIFLVGWVVVNGPVTYDYWQALFTNFWMRLFTLSALVALLAHAWIGLWTIAGDYLNARALGANAGWVRFLFLALCAVAMFVYVVWGIQILWGL